MEFNKISVTQTTFKKIEYVPKGIITQTQQNESVKFNEIWAKGTRTLKVKVVKPKSSVRKTFLSVSRRTGRHLVAFLKNGREMLYVEIFFLLSIYRDF